MIRLLVVACSAACCASGALAGGGPFGIDHRVNDDDHGIWKRNNQKLLEYGVVGTAIAGALWEGDDGGIGHVYWQAVDSLVLASAAAETLKIAFSRARPSQSNNPNDWFEGSGHRSFPSGEVTVITSVVTPFMLEYGPAHPAAYALALLPLYDAVARVKVQAHWQSDVLAGLALGGAIGYYAHERPTSLLVGVLPHGVTVGWHTSF